MRSWFSSAPTVITLIIKTTDGNLEDKIQIQSDESVRYLKTLIDKKFQCDPDLQNLVFQGQALQDEKPLSTYKILDNSTVLLMRISNHPSNPAPNPKPSPKSQRRSIFDKGNPFYQRHSDAVEPGQSSNNNNNNNEPKYFDPILNKLAEFHPELPMAVMANARPIGDLMKDLNEKFEQENEKLNQQQQSLAAYYYYLSLASLSAATKTVASSVYQRLPTKEEISGSIQSIMTTSESTNIDSIRPSLSWMQQLQKLVRNTKEEKAAIDRLVALGFNRRESVEAFLACDKDEALAALFMAQNKTETKGNDEEKNDNASVDASVGYLDDKTCSTVTYNSVYFKQFQLWMRAIFNDDELYYRYVLLFMKQKIADMTCLEDINCDEECLVNIGIEHRIHRKRIMKAIELFLKNRDKFHVWWNATIQFKKYLKLFEKHGIWDLEELLLQIRTKKDIMDIVGMKHRDDVEFIWKHIHNLRKSHSLYSDTKGIAHGTANAYNPNVTSMYTPDVNMNMNYSAPPMHHDMNVNNINIENMSDACMDNNDSQKEGVITQI